ncbi:Uncharacterised protein [uncultured archaeon]|nr:Uncharacterised protein [uncultured archaeon]
MQKIRKGDTVQVKYGFWNGRYGMVSKITRYVIFVKLFGLANGTLGVSLKFSTRDIRKLSRKEAMKVLILI